MSRPWRVRFGGAKYHVTVRGNYRQSLFDADDNYLRFLDQLKEDNELPCKQDKVENAIAKR